MLVTFFTENLASNKKYIGGGGGGGGSGAGNRR
jgi:hypothetical protein